MAKKMKMPFVMIGIVLFIILSIFASVGMYKYKQKKEEEYNAELARLYKHETFALGMDTYDCYKDFSYVDVQILIIKLAAYKHYENEVEITVEDVKEFLSSEYDENGNLYVLNPPDNIAKYIDWYWSGGDSLVRMYLLYLYHFQDDNTEKYTGKGITILDEELLYELIDEFEKCPNREEYEYH